MAKNLADLKSAQTGSSVNTDLYSVGIGVISQGLKRPGCKPDHSFLPMHRLRTTVGIFFLLFIYIVYSQHAPLPSVILHALPDHLHTVLLVSYRIYIPYVWFSCSYVM